MALLTFACGVLFGVFTGFAVALTASLICACVGFFSGRYLSRGWVLKKIASNKKIEALDNAVADKGWKIILLLRLSSILPFMFLNYSLGLSKISFKHYILASSLGMMPGTFLSVYLGSAAGKFLLGADSMPKTPLEWALIAVGIVSTIGVTAYSTSIVKKTLSV